MIILRYYVVLIHRLALRKQQICTEKSIEKYLITN